MPFDPDAYLSAPASGSGFDPDAYLSAPKGAAPTQTPVVAKPASKGTPSEQARNAAWGRSNVPQGGAISSQHNTSDDTEASQDWNWKASRAHMPTLGGLAGAAGMGALGGGVIGGGIGLFTGPGAIPMAAGGAATGALSGIAEELLSDAGFGRGAAMLGSMAVPGEGAAKALGSAVKSAIGETATKSIIKGAGTAKEALSDLMAHSIFGKFAYPLKRANALLEKGKSVDVEAFEKQTGVPAASNIKPGSVENVTAARNEIAAKYGVQADAPESHMYEAAKTGYDNLIRQNMDFTRSKEFLDMIAKYPEKSRQFMYDTYAQIFKQGKSLKPGDVVINDLKNLKLTPTQDKEIRDTFNQFLNRTTGAPLEQQARESAEKVFIAKAKDQLPTLLANSAKESSAAAESRRLLKGQIQNFAKTPETRKVFFEETAHALKDLSVSDAKALWGQIGPAVRKHLIKDPTQYQKITEIMSGARTTRDVGNVTRLLVRISASEAAADGDEQ